MKHHFLNLSMQYFAAEDDFVSGFEEGFGPSENETAEGSALENQEQDISDEGVHSKEDFEASDSENTNPENEEKKYTVKYNGEEKKLSLSELITNAQKGMNYDKVLTERDRLRNSKELGTIDRLAKRNGMSRNQFMESLERQEQDKVYREQLAMGATPEQAEMRAADIKERMEQDRKEALKQDYIELVRAFPDIKELPKEVVNAIAGGESPKSAYMAYENRQLKQKIAAMENNLKARSKYAGSMLGNADGDYSDDFLEGFNSIPI